MGAVCICREKLMVHMQNFGFRMYMQSGGYRVLIYRGGGSRCIIRVVAAVCICRMVGEVHMYSSGCRVRFSEWRVVQDAG